MELEFHQLDLRYGEQRIGCRARARRLVSSLAELGQQVAVTVVADGAQYVLIDGYARVAALQLLGRDTALALEWKTSLAEGLVMHHHQSRRRVGALEEAWLIAHLKDAHGLSLGELATRLCRSKSWVSRRLALVTALDPQMGDAIREGLVPADAAMKYLVPLSRDNKADATVLLSNLAAEPVTTRQLARIYRGYRQADSAGRKHIVGSPHLFLKATDTAVPSAPPPTKSIAEELHTLAAVASRAVRLLEAGDIDVLQVRRIRRGFAAAKSAFATLSDAMSEVCTDDRRRNAQDDLFPASEGALHPRNRPHAAAVAK